MRTLQEKYNAIQEGKFTKDQFLRDARLEQPNLVTRFNGYDDAVQILKNRGMISEVEYSRVLELPDGDYFAIDSDWEDTYKGHNGLFFTIDGNNIYDKDGESIQSSPREFVSQFKPEEILKVEAKLTEDFTEYSNDALADMIINLSRYEGTEEDIRKVKQELQKRKGKLKEAAPRTMQAGFDMVSAEVKKHRELMRVANKLFPEFGGNLQNLKPLSRQQREVVYQNVDIANIKEADTNSTPSFEQWKNIATKNAQTFKSQLAKVGVDSEMPFSLAFKRLSDKQKQQVYNNVINNKLDKVVASKLQEAKQPKLTKKALADYRYKPTNDMDKYPYEQILRGLRVELETMGVAATPTAEEYQKALAKVLKNLEKDSIYYTNQVAGVKPTKKRTDVMIDATAKNEVDKENGLQKAQLKEAFKGLIKKILSEGNEFGEGEEVYEMYGDSDGDYEHDKDTAAQAEMLYDKGQELFNQGKTKQAEALRQHALKTASWLGWGEEDLPPYTQDDEIDYDDENFSDPFIDGDLDEATDTEADKNMVRKFMTMYETEPSKFEKLHKQAQVQAKTTKDIKFKHLLSLLDRAKAGALQSLANQDKFEADREGMEEGYDEDKIAKFEKYTYTLDGKVVKPEIAFFDHILGAELDGKVYKIGIPDETGTVELRSHKGKTGMYTEDVFESVSLKDLLD